MDLKICQLYSIVFALDERTVLLLAFACRSRFLDLPFMFCFCVCTFGTRLFEVQNWMLYCNGGFTTPASEQKDYLCPADHTAMYNPCLIFAPT